MRSKKESRITVGEEREQEPGGGERLKERKGKEKKEGKEKKKDEKCKGGREIGERKKGKRRKRKKKKEKDKQRRRPSFYIDAILLGSRCTLNSS